MLAKHSFLTFCLLALIFSEINCQFHGPPSISDAMSALTKPVGFTERFKRDLSGYCVTSCSMDMESNIAIYFPKLNVIMRRSEYSNDTSPMTQRQFSTLCKKIIHPLNQCLGACSETQSLSSLESKLSPLKFLCVDVYNEFYNSLPCRNNARYKIISTCHNDVCRERKDAPRRLREAARNLRSTDDLSEFEELLAENCRLHSCLVRCEIQVQNSTCGANAAKLTKDYAKVYYASLNKEFQLLSIYPRECTKLAYDENYREVAF